MTSVLNSVSVNARAMAVSFYPEGLEYIAFYPFALFDWSEVLKIET